MLLLSSTLLHSTVLLYSTLPYCTVQGKNALMYAVQFQHELLVSYLTSRPNIAIDAVDTDGYTALVLAVELDGEAAAVGLNMAKVLLLAGANPNVMTFRRKTALRIACSKQDVTMVGRHWCDYHYLIAIPYYTICCSPHLISSHC